MPSSKKVVYFRMTHEMHDLLLELAKEDNRTVSNMVEAMVAKCIKQSKENK